MARQETLTVCPRCSCVLAGEVDYNAVHAAAVRGIRYGVGALHPEAVSILSDARLASQPSRETRAGFERSTTASAIRSSEKQTTLAASHGTPPPETTSPSRATRFEKSESRTANPLLKDSGIYGKVGRQRRSAQPDSYMRTHELDSFLNSLRQILLVKQPENPWALICEEAKRRFEESEQLKPATVAEVENDHDTIMMPQDMALNVVVESQVGVDEAPSVKVKHGNAQTDGFTKAFCKNLQDALMHKDSEIAWLRNQIHVEWEKVLLQKQAPDPEKKFVLLTSIDSKATWDELFAWLKAHDIMFTVNWPYACAGSLLPPPDKVMHTFPGPPQESLSQPEDLVAERPEQQSQSEGPAAHQHSRFLDVKGVQAENGRSPTTPD